MKKLFLLSLIMIMQLHPLIPTLKELSARKAASLEAKFMDPNELEIILNNTNYFNTLKTPQQLKAHIAKHMLAIAQPLLNIREIEYVYISTDNTFFIDIHRNRTANIWTRNPTGIWQTQQLNTPNIRHLYISPDNTFFITVDTDDTASIWTRNPAGTWQPQQLNTPNIRHLYISQDSTFFITIHMNHTATVWENKYTFEQSLLILILQMLQRRNETIGIAHPHLFKILKTFQDDKQRELRRIYDIPVLP